MNISLTRPESLSECRSHDHSTRFYVALGLCLPCAAQAGFGHQHGFSVVNRPCPSCAPIVALLPRQRRNGWLSVQGRPRMTEQGELLSRFATAASARNVARGDSTGKQSGESYGQHLPLEEAA